jgi:carbon storage regulator
MLTLTLGVGESLDIGDDIKVSIISVLLNQVRIGISAPKDIVIKRKELNINAISWQNEGGLSKPKS